MIATLIRPVAAATQTLYRYVGKERGLDGTSTRRHRKKLKKLTLEIIDHDGAYARCKASDGSYHNWIPLDHLEPAGEDGGAL